MKESRGVPMTIAYIIFISIIVISFITGTITTIIENKTNKTRMIFKKGIIIDEDVLWKKL